MAKLKDFRECTTYTVFFDEEIEDLVFEAQESKDIPNEAKLLILKLWKEYNLANDHRKGF